MQSNRKTGVERAEELRRTLSPDDQEDVFGECCPIDCPHCKNSLRVELVSYHPKNNNRTLRCPACSRGAGTITCFEVLPPYDTLLLGEGHQGTSTTRQ